MINLLVLLKNKFLWAILALILCFGAGYCEGYIKASNKYKNAIQSEIEANRKAWDKEKGDIIKNGYEELLKDKEYKIKVLQKNIKKDKELQTILENKNSNLNKKECSLSQQEFDKFNELISN